MTSLAEYQPAIKTARLTLDPPSPNDDPAMRDMFSDIPTMEFLRFKTKEEKGGWTMPEVVDRREGQSKLIEKRAGSTFYIHLQETGELAGVMGANNINRVDRNADVGIILWKKFWSGGYGTEALYELMRGLFEDDKLHKITYETTEKNEGMRGFLENACGIPLTYINKDELMCTATHKWVSFYVYVIFEEDWPRIKVALLEKMRAGAAKYASKA
ncbi:hypothetical protein BGZ95_009645 [Linnemannia exigua]|uniref:N-acetyltransferase domain-containing protein n=1 Tax=Linnemannia exigua TaxID=604196 RepID=A0AAD4DE80_9FUNG|nr:hypothetical protein BGZ95_009645 [Linnemannia exigua]